MPGATIECGQTRLIWEIAYKFTDEVSLIGVEAGLAAK
ncbi:hypothetical protein RK21_05644 [Pseudomonas plecoglossicida]|jgi:hypothetical protein|nr:hypothetical protein RK21_05644 [Pseudomonas plecoglossicida]